MVARLIRLQAIVFLKALIVFLDLAPSQDVASDKRIRDLRTQEHMSP